MMKRTTLLGLTLLIAAGTACAGVLDPECTAQKAAKGAAAKATVGVGGRCSPAEAVKDTAKRATGIEDKGTLKPGADTEKGAAKKTAK